VVRTFWAGRGGGAIECRDFVGVRVTVRAVACCQFSDELGNRDAEFGSLDLEHVGGVLVDVDVTFAAMTPEYRFPEAAAAGLRWSRGFDSGVRWRS
jgi:hypothetical protein